MKKQLTLLTIAITLTTAAWAQPILTTGSPDASLHKKATELTRAMESTVHFNEYEYIQIVKLNKMRLVDMKEAITHFETNDAGLKVTLAKIETRYDELILNLLNPRQKQGYAIYKRSEAALLTNLL